MSFLHLLPLQDTPGPYLLDIMVPHIEHVLPMIPGGGSFRDIITKGADDLVADLTSGERRTTEPTDL